MGMLGRVVFPLAVLMAVVQAEYTTDDIVDLTTSLKTNASMHWIGWPYGFIKSNLFKVEDNGTWMESNAINMAIHTGTHMDAPCHFSHRLHGKGEQRLHEVPITRFFGPAAVIDVKAKVDEDDDYELTMDDVTAWEEINGLVPDGAIVLVHTGWAKRYYGDQKRYWGTTDVNQKDLLKFPGVTGDVARYLVEERKINALGIDAGSPDGGKAMRASQHPVHLTVLDNNRLIIENVSPELERMPPTGYRIHAMPLKLYDTCGSPIRLMAFKIPETSRAVGTAGSTAALLLLLSFSLFLLLQ